MHLNGVSESEDMYTSMDQVTQKLEAQIRRQKEKMRDRKQKGERKSAGTRIDVISSDSVGKGSKNFEVLNSDQASTCSWTGSRTGVPRGVGT